MISDYHKFRSCDVAVETLHCVHEGQQFAVGGAEIGFCFAASPRSVTNNVRFVVGLQLF